MIIREIFEEFFLFDRSYEQITHLYSSFPVFPRNYPVLRIAAVFMRGLEEVESVDFLFNRFGKTKHYFPFSGLHRKNDPLTNPICILSHPCAFG
jgi:hypothetical protein